MSPLLTRAGQIAGLDTSPLLRLRLMSESLLTIIFHRLDHIWVYEHDYRDLGGAELRTLLAQRKAFEHCVSGVLVEAVYQGALQTTETRLATLQFLNLHNHTYQWVRPHGPWSPAFLSRECCSTFFRGFGAPESVVREVETRAQVFKHLHTELPLDPEADWIPVPAGTDV
ncbi:TetR/AcrR family transcriptional regulator [Streptomyces sp. NPDC102462]|uniref:TetR/AcrR family transcriptional regulator n=1 Tax=Streptomyces sp. NPDC102462 TaxID=3366178 RepID=UPI0037F818C2